MLPGERVRGSFDAPEAPSHSLHAQPLSLSSLADNNKADSRV
jgi:hypothetical protein